MFVEDCYWRDLVSFTWNLKTLEGTDRVGDMLQQQLASVKPSNWMLDDNEEPTEEEWFVIFLMMTTTKVNRLNVTKTKKLKCQS